MLPHERDREKCRRLFRLRERDKEKLGETGRKRKRDEPTERVCVRDLLNIQEIFQILPFYSFFFRGARQFTMAVAHKTGVNHPKSGKLQRA